MSKVNLGTVSLLSPAVLVRVSRSCSSAVTQRSRDQSIYQLYRYCSPHQSVFPRQRIRLTGCGKYRVRSGLARKYRIGLNIVRRGKIGVKGLFLEYGEYSAEYSATPSLKPLTRWGIFWEYAPGIWLRLLYRSGYYMCVRSSCGRCARVRIVRCR